MKHEQNIDLESFTNLQDNPLLNDDIQDKLHSVEEFELKFPISIFEMLLTKSSTQPPQIVVEQNDFELFIQKPTFVQKAPSILYVLIYQLIIHQDINLGPKLIQYANDFPQGLIDFSIYFSLIHFSAHVFPEFLIFLLSIATPSFFINSLDDINLQSDILLLILATILSKEVFKSPYFHYLLSNAILNDTTINWPEKSLHHIFSTFSIISEIYTIEAYQRVIHSLPLKGVGIFLKSRISYLCIFRALNIEIPDFSIFDDPHGIISIFPAMQEYASYPDDDFPNFDNLINITQVIPDFILSWQALHSIDTDFIATISNNLNTVIHKAPHNSRHLLKECIQLTQLILTEC